MTDPAPTNLSQRIAALSPEQRALFEQRLRKMGLNLETAPTQQTIPRRPPSSGPLQVSFAQQRLWFLNQLETNSPFYNIPMGLRMSGPLDVDALRCSFAEIVRRHEILRTTFVSDRGQPRQVIHESMPITVPLIDLQGLPASDRQAESERLTDIEIRLPYDLEGGPLFRATVLRTGAEDHILLLSIHHTVADGWSRGVLLRELAELYAAFVEGKPSSLPELQIQYADFAIWQRNWLQEEQQTAQLQFWQRQLDGLSELNLPKDRQRVGQQTYRGAKLLRVLPQSLLGSVKQLSQAEGTTLFMTLLSVFKVLLHRYTGQTDIAVGSPTANRNWKEIEPLIGFFVNALVLRTDLSGDPTFRDVLHAVQTVTLDAFSHRDIPFENLVESLQPDRSLSYNPLFQVAFQFQDASYEAQNSLLPSLNFPNLSLERLEIDQGTSIFDLTVNMGEIAEGLGVLIEYSTDLFDRWRIEQMLEHFQELLRGAISAPDSPISQLPLLRADERHQLLVKWNATEVNYPSDCCIHQLFERQVECSPNAVAVVYEDQPLSYWELNERANQLAHHLQQLGVGPETLVGICIERSLEMVVGLLGILKAGGAYVPLDPGYPPERLAYMLADSQVPILLTQSSLLDGLPQHEARLICLDRDWPAISRHSSLNLNTQVSSDNLAYVIYTSGSTGRPKGVMNRHVSICNRLLWMQDAYQLTPEDRVLQKTPFSFDVSVWEFFWPLWVGAKLVLAKPEGHKDSHYLVNLIVQQNITTVHFVPPMLAVFLQNPDVRRLKCLKRVICSGEALSIQLQTDFFEQLDCELHNLYGPTEAAIDVTAWSCHAARCGAVVPIGRPIANTQIYILDSRSQPLPIGVPGELHIGGIGLARGYLNRPQLTAEKFIANPFGDGRLYKTGDLARYLPNGSIEYLGRLDHQVKIRGFRIELGEIEATLAQHPAIQASTVTVRKDRLGHQQLVAYVVSDSEQASPLSTLQQLKEQGRLTDGSLYELPNGMVISHLNKTETDFLYQEIYEAKCYLQHGITIRAGDCIFDVGANIGLFTLFAAQSAPDVSVYAFEPIPSVFEKLQLNVELYGLEATLFPLGVANEVRSESFTYYPNVSIISGRFGNVEQEKEVLKSFLLKQLAIHGDEETVTQNSLDELLADRLQSQTVACQLTTLSDVIREQGIDRIDLLKIDVEKSEQDILDGIHVQDWPKIKQLVVEVHNINGRLAKIQTLLQTHGYDVTVTQDSLLDRTELYSIYAKQGNSGSSSDSADSTLASLGASALQTEQVEFWQQLYNETYSQTPDELQGTFNITGWNSSYTGLPLPAAAMREWVDNTVERILALKPKRVLELGCGTGLLLFPVAPKCEQYWGTDFSAVALEAIRSQLDNPDLHLPQVQLEQRPADDFNGIPTAAFDTVVINSVIQYFPSADYLLETIAGALNALAPGGSLFIGDVRNFALIDSFHTALALHRAEADLEIARLQSRIHDEITRDKELLVQPTFFCALRERFPQIVDVRVQPKLGRHDNELTQYRYDVVLTIGELSGGDDVSESPSWQDWRATSLELKTLGETLEQSQPAIVALSNIPNGRTGNMQAAIAAISPTIGLDDEESPTTVEELRSYLQEQPRDSIDPQQIWDLGNSLNYSVEVSWLNEYPDGGFDAILRHRQAPTPPKLDFPIAAAAALPLQNLTNNPLQSRHSGELVPQLRDYLLKKLPDYMVPAIFVVMDELPLTPNGKIDRRALPDPDAARASTRTEFVQPKTPSEVAIAAIWSELLGVEQIGCNDHFFVLGGHSLLATQVLSRLQQELQVELPLRILFEAMTVAELAAIVDEAKGESGAGMTAIEPVARPEAIPLSFAQQRLWFVNQLLPDSPAYNMPAFVSLKGDLNVDALRRSLNEIVRRHETLRTNIREQKGTPAQIITKERLLELPIIEFQNSSMDGLSPEVEQWLLAEAKQPFNIESDPLLRVTLVKLADRDHILSVTMHHIVSDGWSAGILVKELAALYQAYISDRPSPLPELPIQYTDFAIWQRQHLKGERLEELLGFWQQQVAGMPDILDLPTDHPRPPLQTFNGTKAPIEFDAELTRSLLELGRRTDATLFMTLLAGFQLTIYAYTQQEKFLLGSPIANRNRPETEGLVGFFVNTLVLPADLSGDPTFEQLLGQVRESCLGAYSHQDLPFEKLLETIPFSRDLSRTPMVQAAFALQNAASTTLDLSGLTVSLADIDTGTAKIDLTVLMNARDPEAGDDSGLRGALEYNTDLFEAATANRIIELYRQVLKLATAQSDRPISQLLAEFDLSQCRPAPQTAVARGAQAVEERVASNDPQTQFEQLLEQTNLTANQLLIWLGEQLHPGTPLYNHGIVIDIDGAISPPHLQAAWQTLIDSNDALRLTISNEGSLPKQTFAERIDCPLEFVDFTTEAEKGEAQGLINEWLEARTNKLFDLSSSPIDGALLKQADDKYTLFYNIHHIAADGVSIQIVFDQLSEFYELAVAGDLPTVVEKTQFEPYRTQEDTYRQSARYTKSKQYWAQTLETTEAATYLGRASHKTSVDRNRITCELDVPMTKALKSFAVEIAKSGQTTESAALTNLLLAIYAAYLYRIGSSNRVSIGIPLHNRRTKSLKTALGLFMQVVPIQVDIDPAESIVDLSQRIAALTLEAMRHGRFPLRNSPQQPVYDAIFNLHIISRSKFGPFPAQNRWIHSGSGTDSIALQVADFSSSGTFEFSFDLHKEIFDEPLGQLAVRQFLQFFQEILRDRDRPLSQLPLLSPEDQQSLLTRFNPSGIPNPAETTVVARIEARTRALPTSIAATDGKQSLTYAQLNAKANQLARYLQAQGVGPESRVGICCQRSLDLVVAFLGSLKAGAAYVPLDAAYPDDRLHSIIDDAAVSLILTQAPLLSRFNQQCADSQQNSSKRDLQLIGLDTGWEAISREQDDNLNLVIHPESLAYIIYTSGSSGLPKGVGIPHKALASFTETAISRYQFSEDDRILQFASASFDAAVEEIFPCLSVGATLYLRKDEMLASPIAFAQACADWQLTVLDLPTAYWQEMVRSLADSNLPLTPSLRLVIIGGERALAEGYDRWQILCERQTSNACPSLINTYGPTETTVVSTTYTCSESVESGINSDTESSIPIGAPLDNASVYILDRHLQPVPVGVPGELYIGGYGLARGYLNRPDLTAEAFVPNPFSSVPGDRLYRTGDLGRYRDDGAIVFLGRRDRQVKWCGFRIELADIETALSALSGVKEAAVMLRQDRPQLPRLVAYYTSTNADEGHKPNQLRSLLQAKLPQYMLPSHYVALESMPLTPSGKLDRSALPAPSSDRSQLDTAFVKPTTELERTIAEIWQQVLGVDRVGLHDNFFDLGGHSLLLVQVHSQLLQELEARNTPDDTGELSLVDLFQYPTVQRLADRIAQGGHRVEDLAARAEHRASKQKQALSQRKRPPVRRQTHG